MVTIVQTVAPTDSYGDPGSFPDAATSGSTIVAVIAWHDSSDATTGLATFSDTVNGDYALLTPQIFTFSGAKYGVQIAYFVGNANTTTMSFSYTWDGGNPTHYYNSLYELSACSYDQQNGTSNGTGYSPTGGSITTTVNGAIGICGMIYDDGVGGGNAFTPGTGWTFDANTGFGSWEIGAESNPQSTAGVLNSVATAGGTSHGWAAAFATFVPASSSSPPTMLLCI